MATSNGPKIGSAVFTVTPSMEGSRTAIQDAIVPDAEKAGKEAGKRAGAQLGEGLSTAKLAIGNALGNLLSSAISKATEGIKDTFTTAFNNYANYQQLTGGVETLFKESSNIVMGYAENAYKTAGMSANEYMETVTGFSASLLDGLGGDTQKAAQYADMAVTDMSDNANKMGTDMGLIQNAYQGFAKDNYTMLDNLKLGFGGTREEAARLVNESGVMGESFVATAKNMDEVPFDKFIEAIHKTQENMGITGTTAEEASQTISGSIDSMASAWDNWLTGLANPDANMDQLTQQLIESIKTVIDNVLPALGDMFDGAIDAIGGVLEEAGFEGATETLHGVKDALEGAFNWIIENGDLIMSITAGIVAGIVAFQVASTVAAAVGALSTALTIMREAETLAAGAQALLNAVMEANPIVLIISLIAALVAALVWFFTQTEEGQRIWGDFCAVMGDLWQGLCDFLTELWNQIGDTVMAVWTGITEFLSAAWETISTVAIDTWNALVAFFTEDPLGQAITQVFQGIMDFLTGAWEFISGIVKTAVGFIVGLVTGDFSMMEEGVEGIMNGFGDMMSGIWNAISSLIEAIVRGIAEFLSNAWETIVNVATDAWNGLVDFISGIPDAIIGFLSSIPGAVSDIFGMMRDWVGERLNEAIDFFTSVPERIAEFFGQAKDWAIEKLTGMLDFIRDIPGKVGDFFASIPDKIAGVFSNIHIPTFHVDGHFNLDPWNFELPHIAFYKKGGIVGSPQLGVFGENGVEGNFPMEGRYMRNWTGVIAEGIVDNGGGMGGDNYNISIDGNALYTDEYLMGKWLGFMDALRQRTAMKIG